MDQIDYIIVGGGFAGFFLAHHLQKNNKSFVLFNGQQISGSHISAGVCNPVILKRFSTFWKSKEQMDYLETIFSDIETYTGNNYIINEPVARIFHDKAEKVQWRKNSLKEDLEPFLDNDFINLNGVENPLESGIVKNSCRIDVENFFKDMFDHFDTTGNLINESFDHNSIDIENSIYKNFKFKGIVFCEGIHTKDNPYFNTIPVLPNKGHCLEVKIEQALDPFIIKKKHFLFSLSDNRFYYGGTYDRFDRTEEIDPEFIEELETGLKAFYKGNYSITKIKTAFRATVDDRRPILGSHPEFHNLKIFNGLGARGVLNGTYFSKVMFDYLENQIDLDPEIDVKRFY
ncbi:NAD(P)/FAD-dependent oxidoreductase [Epilithonimonas sp. UC225_85]|uniref:NAD(P)/FAD-dependent oxidoreductase n=1 Tax=Epilithonimonas sp. UC225_85 TaxID=3350167 RepID=UPI0036D33DF2